MDDVTEYILTQCIHCQKKINGKPWISVMNNGCIVNACGYSCSNHLSNYVGIGYFDRIINKEDFNEPRPVMKVNTTTEITSSSYFDRTCRDIVDQEQFNIDKVFEYYSDYYNESSNSESEEYSD